MNVRVYIASPYTIGDKEANVKAQLVAYHELRDRGFFPFAPLLSHYVQLVRPRLYEDWMTIDFEWLEACDAVLRLPGESSGADREVAHAAEESIPVFYTLESLCSAFVVPLFREPL